MKIKINEMSFSELQDLKAKVDAEIAEREKRQGAFEELKQKAVEMGLNMNDIIYELTGKGKGRTPRRSPANGVAVKYRHPKDPTKTWTGRGKTPIWVREATEKEGLTLDALKKAA